MKAVGPQYSLLVVPECEVNGEREPAISFTQLCNTELERIRNADSLLLLENAVLLDWELEKQGALSWLQPLGVELPPC